MPNSWSEQVMKEKHGVHHAGLVERIIADRDLQRGKFWDRNTMYVTMPQADKSLHLTRVQMPWGQYMYQVEPAALDSRKTWKMLAEAPAQPNRRGLMTQQAVGRVITHCRELQLKRSAPEGVAQPAPAR